MSQVINNHNLFTNNTLKMTKIYQSVIVEGVILYLPYTQHLQYIFINVIEVYFQGTFIIHVKVYQTHFYRKQ